MLETERRTRFIVVQHFAAVIEEQDNGERFATVDSWFVDNGQPAVAYCRWPWMEGEGPSVE